MNNAIFVGKITNITKLEESEGTILTITISRNYKNEDGIYESDDIKCYLNNNLAENSLQYLSNGDIVGIKGHLQQRDNNLIVIIDRLTFLSSRKNEED